MEVLSVIDSHLGYLLPRAGMARLTRHKRMRGTVSHPFGKQAWYHPTYGDSDWPSLISVLATCVYQSLEQFNVHMMKRCYISVRILLVLIIQLAHNIYLPIFYTSFIYIILHYLLFNSRLPEGNTL